MDPWCGNNPSQISECQLQGDSFEDNFKPTVGETLPDSEKYLEALENKLFKLKNDSNVLRQLAEKREACMRSLLNGETDYNRDTEELDSPINPSSILRVVAPERQALTAGEVVELVKYDLLNSEEDSDTASR